MDFTESELRAVKEKMLFFEKLGYKLSESKCCKEVIDYSNGKIVIIVFNGRYYDPKDVTLEFLPERDFYKVSWIEFIAEHREERGEKESSHDLMYLVDYLIEHYDQLKDRKYCAECEKQYLAYWERKKLERLNDRQ